MNIYVGNLSFDTSEDDLRAEFEAFGRVSSVKIITNRDTGRSRGFGFVEMDNDDEGRAAMESLDGREVGGRTLKVNEARPREDRPRSQGSGRGYGGGGRGDQGGGGERPRGGGSGGATSHGGGGEKATGGSGEDERGGDDPAETWGAGT